MQQWMAFGFELIEHLKPSVVSITIPFTMQLTTKIRSALQYGPKIIILHDIYNTFITPTITNTFDTNVLKNVISLRLMTHNEISDYEQFCELCASIPNLCKLDVTNIPLHLIPTVKQLVLKKVTVIINGNVLD